MEGHNPRRYAQTRFESLICDNDYDEGSVRRRKVRVHVLDSDFCKYGRHRLAHRAAGSQKHPRYIQNPLNDDFRLHYVSDFSICQRYAYINIDVKKI